MEQVSGPVDDGIAVARLVRAPAQRVTRRTPGVCGADVPARAQVRGRLWWFLPGLKTPQPYNGNFLEFTVLEVTRAN
jgi:hypothetical protein